MLLLYITCEDVGTISCQSGRVWFNFRTNVFLYLKRYISRIL